PHAGRALFLPRSGVHSRGTDNGPRAVLAARRPVLLSDGEPGTVRSHDRRAQRLPLHSLRRPHHLQTGPAPDALDPAARHDLAPLRPAVAGLAGTELLPDPS